MATGAPDHFKRILLYGLTEADEPLSAYITDDGRFVFRLEDWPDIWGEAARVGLAEVLAVTTGAKRFDRRGQTIFYENFDCGLQRVSGVGVGTGGAFGIDSDYARTGGHSVKLTAGSDGLREAYFRAYVPLYAHTKLGLEVSFTFDTNTEYNHFMLKTTGLVRGYWWGLKFDQANTSLYYFNSAAGWTLLANDVLFTASKYIWNTIKFVADRSTGQYLRAMFNERTFDLSGIAGWEDVGPDVELATIEVYVKSETGQNAVMRVDDVILTQNEPE